MNVGSPLHGVHFGFSLVGPFDPTTVANVVRVMDYRFPWPQNSLGVFPYTGDSCGPGDGVAVCPDQYATFNVGPEQYDRVFNSSSADGPLFESTGLEFDDAGVLSLNLYNNVVQTGLTAWTGYFWGTYVGGSTWVAVGNVSGNAIVLLQGNSATWQDDDGNTDSTGNTVSAGLILVRINTNGSRTLIAASPTATKLTASATTTSSFDSVGQAGGSGQSNSDTGNRYLGSIIVARDILPGDPDDVSIRNWISGINAGYVVGVLPQKTVTPAITSSGSVSTPHVGDVLTCGTGTWIGDPTIVYTFQWSRSTSGNILGATSATYTVATLDLTHTLRCVVTATNSAGATTQNTSNTGTVS